MPHVTGTVQMILPELVIDVPVTDLGSFSAANREAGALRAATEEAARPFDLSIGPLIRARIIRLETLEHICVVTLHHIVFDGWSANSFYRELAALYESFSANKPSPLPQLRIQYADYASWQRNWLGGEKAAQQLAYWKEQLAGMPPVLMLPADRPRTADCDASGAVEGFQVAADVAKHLRLFSVQSGATLYMTLLAAFQVLLRRWTGATDFAVGAPVANRNKPETEALIGFFVNTLVLRADTMGNPKFVDLLAQVKETTLAGYAHQDMPFEMLVDVMGGERDRSYPPLVQVALVMQNTGAFGRAPAAQWS